MAKFVKFDAPKDMVDQIYESVEIAKNTGKLRKGVNETTKCVERGLAKLVILASDVEPPEILMHLPAVCSEKKVECVEVPSKLELGKAAGVDISASSIAIEEAGDAKRMIDTVKKKVDSLKK